MAYQAGLPLRWESHHSPIWKLCLKSCRFLRKRRRCRDCRYQSCRDDRLESSHSNSPFSFSAREFALATAAFGAIFLNMEDVGIAAEKALHADHFSANAQMAPRSCASNNPSVLINSSVVHNFWRRSWLKSSKASKRSASCRPECCSPSVRNAHQGGRPPTPTDL